jgi:hypothetical protein
MALGHLRQRPGEIGNLAELAGSRPDASECGDGEAKGSRIDVQPVAGNHSGPLKALHALGDRRGAHLDTARQGRHAHARVIAELGQQAAVDVIKQAVIRSSPG